MIKSTSAFRGWINFQAVYVLSKFCVLGNCILLLLELPFWNPPAASICKNLQSGLYSSSPASPCIVQLCLVKCEECGDNDCLEWRAQKPAQRPEFHPPSRSHAGLLAIWGGGGGGGVLRGFPALNLSLPAAAKVKFQPTRSVSGPEGSKPTQRKLVSNQYQSHWQHFEIMLGIINLLLCLC